MFGVTANPHTLPLAPVKPWVSRVPELSLSLFRETSRLSRISLLQIVPGSGSLNRTKCHTQVGMAPVNGRFDWAATLGQSEKSPVGLSPSTHTWEQLRPAAAQLCGLTLGAGDESLGSLEF